jgi:hypothetical protein
MSEEGGMIQVIPIDEGRIRDHLGCAGRSKRRSTRCWLRHKRCEMLHQMRAMMRLWKGPASLGKFVSRGRQMSRNY